MSRHPVRDAQGRADPPRTLGLGAATALVVASMIGTGVFTTSGLLLAELQEPLPVLAAWILGGIVAACGALSYGALARRFPESGGEYLFLSRTLHPAAGFIAGWISLLVGFSAPLAAAAYALGDYTKGWFGPVSPQIPGTLMILLFSMLHASDVTRGARVQNWAVLLKVLLIAGFISRGFSHPIIREQTAANRPDLHALAVALVWVSFSYSGWNAAIYIASEVKDPVRNLPRALLLGTGLVTVLYFGINASILLCASAAALKGRVEIGRIAAEAWGGSKFAEEVTAMIGAALVTTISAMIMAGPRVYARMARDGCLPRLFAAASGQPPRAAIALQAVLALAMLWSSTYDRLLTYIGFTLSLSTAAAVLGLVRLRLKEKKGFPVPGWPWVPLAFLAAVVWMALFSISRRPLESMLGFATIGAGWAGWFFLADKKIPPGARH